MCMIIYQENIYFGPLIDYCHIGEAPQTKLWRRGHKTNDVSFHSKYCTFILTVRTYRHYVALRKVDTKFLHNRKSFNCDN